MVFSQCDNVKGVARSDEPTENYHLNLQLPSTLPSFIVSFSSLARSFPVSVHSHHFHTVILNATCSAPNSRQAQLATGK